MKRSLLSLSIASAMIVLTSFSTPEAQAEGAKKPAKQGAPPTPASLVNDMQKAVAFIAKASVQSQPPVSVKSKEARPFWTGLKGVSKGLDEMEEGIKAQDGKMLGGLEEVGEGLTTLTAAWGVLHGGHKGSHVGRGVTALSEAYDLYLHHYGPAVARYKKGGKVSAAEFDQVAQAHAQLDELAPKLAALEPRAKKNSYQQRLIADLRFLVKDLRKVEVTNVKSYSKFVYQWDRLREALESYNELIDAWYPSFVNEWEVVSTNAKTVEAMFADNSSYYEGWKYTERPIKDYGVYYNRTEAVSTITEEEKTSFESSVESYSEESATEESSEETSEIDEEVEVSDDENHSLFEEVEMGENDGDDADAGDEAEANDDGDDDGIADDVEGGDDGGDDN